MAGRPKETSINQQNSNAFSSNTNNVNQEENNLPGSARENRNSATNAPGSATPISASQLPKRNVINKRQMRLKSLYDILEEKYHLPKFGTSACTRERLLRLQQGTIYGALLKSSLSPPVPKKKVPIYLLHEIFIRTFRTTGKVCFHDDCIANYKYYVLGLYLLDADVFRTTFEISPEPKITLAPPVIPRPASGAYPGLGYGRRTEDDLRSESVDIEIVRKQDYVSLKNTEYNKEIHRKVKNLWKYASNLVNSRKWVRMTNEKVDQISAERILDDDNLNNKVLSTVKGLITEHIAPDIVTYAQENGFKISSKDPHSFFSQDVRTTVRVKKIDTSKPFEPAAAKVYFENLVNEDNKKLQEYLLLLSNRYRCLKDWDIVFEKILENLNPSVHGILMPRILTFNESQGDIVFWNTFFSVAVLPSSNDILKEISPTDIYDMRNYPAIDWKYFSEKVTTSSAFRIKENLNLLSVCSEMTNIICGRFCKLFNVIPIDLPESFHQLYSDAMCNINGVFGIAPFLAFVNKWIGLIKKIENLPSIRLSNLESIIIEIAQSKGHLDLNKLFKKGEKTKRFETIIDNNDIQSVISQVGAMFYPTTDVMNHIKSSRQNIGNYLFCVISAYIYSGYDNDLAVFARCCYSILRKALWNNDYLIFLFKVSSYFSSPEFASNPSYLFSILKDVEYSSIKFSIKNEKKVFYLQQLDLFKTTYGAMKETNTTLLDKAKKAFKSMSWFQTNN